ncbi:hypothetical protein GWI33_005206 [Rhynchophorus ferrugineus]|uniref:Uncharacterized protein n=1 Tax=Rhynchophorus ferrugineus TaxID=354439 RepID=A0A834IND7_RHYFE|nr:hypothetical protein GWI33_005206 [Rhynchophorus ferrugineus]
MSGQSNQSNKNKKSSLTAQTSAQQITDNHRNYSVIILQKDKRIKKIEAQVIIIEKQVTEFVNRVKADETEHEEQRKKGQKRLKSTSGDEFQHSRHANNKQRHKLSI